MRLDSAASQPITFSVADSEKMRIDANGNVIIGATTPDDVGGASKLSVDVGTGQGSFRLQNGGTDGVYFRRITTGGHYQIQTTLNDGTAGVLSLQSYGGSVGIGTTSPSAKLMIETGADEGIRIFRSATNANFGAIEFRNSDDSATNSRIGFGTNYMRIEGTDNLQFITNTSERLRITSAGKVGIGTTSPGGELHIVGATGGAAQLYLSDADNGTGTSDGLLITKSGTNAFVYNRDDGQMSFGTNDTSNTLVIANTQNVAIGNTNPSQKLHVTGSILASSDVVAFSDKKLKENIKTLDGSKVYNMRGVSFTRKDTGKDSSGVIAQEIQKIAPELVTDNDGTLSVAYGNLTGYLIEAVKELKTEVEQLKQQIKNGNNL